MFMKYFAKISLISALVLSPVLALAGPSGFLENYALLRPGKFVNEFYVNNQAIRDKGYISFVVIDVDASRIKDSWGMESEDAAIFLKRELEESANRFKIGRFFRFEPGDRDRAQAVLEMAVTEQSTGSPPGRIFAILGWGQPYLRVEGNIRDAQTNQILASFNHFQSTKAIWPFRDLNGGFAGGGNTMLKEIYIATADKITEEIGNSFGLIPETLKGNLPFKYT